MDVQDAWRDGRSASARNRPAATQPGRGAGRRAVDADGNTLLVPVETAISGASGHPTATSRHVPSPPSDDQRLQPCSVQLRRRRVACRAATRAGSVDQVDAAVEAGHGALGEPAVSAGRRAPVGAGLDGGDDVAADDADLGRV